MAEVMLFHHAQGLTPGVEAFADRLRAGAAALLTERVLGLLARV